MPEKSVALSDVSHMTVLVVDDDRAVREACQAIAESQGMKTFSAASAREGLSLIEQMPVDVVLTDLRMPGMDGIRFLEAIRKLRPDVYVVIMSGYGSIETAVESMQKGATAFISKPFRVEELRQTLHHIAEEVNAHTGHRELHQGVDCLDSETLLTGRSPDMQQLYRAVKRAAGSSTPVLILGEQGTGKEALAIAIHLSVKGPTVPFIPVDCCSLSPELLEGELFGHVKGSFPAAMTDKPGLLAGADGGTVLLNGISDLPIDTQGKLARALQTKAIRPYGAAETVPLRARIMATSHHDLAEIVARGNFRQDLYYMLSVLVLRLPPLRQRHEDLPLIVAHYMEQLKKEYGVEKTLTPEAMSAISAHAWPGNLRELQAALEHAYLLAAGSSIDVPQLPFELTAPALPSPGSEEGRRNLSLAELEREGILNTLKETHGDKQKAAKMLGVSRTTLYRKLNEYKLPS